MSASQQKYKYSLRHMYSFLIFLLILSSGCTIEELTAPEQDPLVGEWIGSFQKIGGYEAGDETLEIIIRTGGTARGTGYCNYEDGGGLWSEGLTLEFEVKPSGEITGTGAWYIVLFGSGLMYTEGNVSGSFDPILLTGSGSLDVEMDDGIYSFNWHAEKRDKP